MKRIHTYAIALLAFSSFHSQAQDWSLEVDKENIKVYTREVEGSSMDEFKAITTLNFPLSKVFETLKDASVLSEWSKNTSHCEVVEAKDNVQYRYSISDAPFPIDDRDSYVKFTYTESANRVRIDIEAVPEYGPKKEDYVRVTESKGYYLLEKLADNQTRITYQLHAEPGGSVPGWLANSASTDIPFNALTGLKQYLEE
ncbi:START domain-containing protein [Phaeocystidibacter marisrubri]|uniref:START domain-containing protein n=1 Tax=Phaeocystidibacter marisrubri TaxID=1577780 RepID=A0A6L3ZID3_9FLAO|nr:START domain-containing protein [Phaeocystidibacter marisrubri]KAB2817383.1 hypothetical protein F8C82_03030 [Phaeocystidibacter marisrubri]GGH75618.1 hypothetical protein GCM10011318_22830 [Phaeocystidibacter marisrubri]